MYHSVTFGSMNSFSDWHLVPEGRPVIALPEPKLVTVDVPGGNGVLDLSETLTKYPVYNNRTGQISFHVLNGFQPWQQLYQTIANYLHGKKRSLILEDDPLYFYQGRYKVTWTSNNDGTWSDIDIDYDLDPYKYIRRLSTAEDSTCVVTNSGSSDSKTVTFPVLRENGSQPVIPTFVVSNIGVSGLTISLTNPELSITNRSKTVSANGSRTFYDMILSNMSGTNAISVKITGQATVSIQFRRASL